MARKRITTRLLLLAVALLAAAGCKSPYMQHEADLRPLISPRGTLGSQALSPQPPTQRYAGSQWYDSRNDARVAVNAGFRGPVLEFQTTYTYDHQQSFDGRVFDRHHRRTYRQTVTESRR